VKEKENSDETCGNSQVIIALLCRVRILFDHLHLKFCLKGFYQLPTIRVTESPKPWAVEGLLTLILPPLPRFFELGSPLSLGDSPVVLVLSFALMVFWLAESRFVVKTERTIKHY
jgi:hypothetical protein